jgi:hypothetical protein
MKGNKASDALSRNSPLAADRAALEMKIMKYRALARDAPDKLTTDRIETLVAELEQKRREIDE